MRSNSRISVVWAIHLSSTLSYTAYPQQQSQPEWYSCNWEIWSRFQKAEKVFDFNEARETVQEYCVYRPLSRNEKKHLFDIYKLTILFDCFWYFH